VFTALRTFRGDVLTGGYAFDGSANMRNVTFLSRPLIGPELEDGQETSREILPPRLPEGRHYSTLASLFPRPNDVEFNMSNLFNQKTARHIFNCLNYDCVNGQLASGMDMSKVNLFAGFDYKALINASTNGKAYAAGTPGALNPFDPRYKKEDLWNPGFQARLGVKFTF